MRTKLGICMDGLESSFLGAIKSTMPTKDGVWTYLEIGVAYGGTLNGVSTLAKDNTSPWRCIGVDLPNGWSLDLKHIESQYKTFTIRTDIPRLLPVSGTTVFLIGSENMVPRFDDKSADAVFIDGCHEYECCISDFVSVERIVKPGGVVIFHDAGRLQQGGDPQPHKGKPIEVYNALVDMGLIGNTRPGWSKVELHDGNMSIIAIVRKL
jgi:SAM-dependent methyltransferase